MELLRLSPKDEELTTCTADPKATKHVDTSKLHEHTLQCLLQGLKESVLSASQVALHPPLYRTPLVPSIDYFRTCILTWA